ncbi:MAG: aldehyde dehydrogenase family protein [Treponema sp.]|nr:aldehyde dehydrogenase family protein [Treponema sp.]
MEVKDYIQSLVKRAQAAQKIAEGHDQKRVNELTAAVAWFAMKEDFRQKAGEMLVEESKMGVVASKVLKLYNKAKGVYSQMKDDISVGVVEDDPKRRIMKYVKPMGVIGAILPVTNGEATPVVKALWALKTRNAVILAPHPKGKETCKYIADYIRSVLKKYKAPEDLVIAMDPDQVSVESSQELMKQVDFVVATGGTPMVRQAYSSGTPTIGVGTGNVVTYVDNSANADDVADRVKRSKMFDNGSSCSSENSAVVHKDVYDPMLAAFEKAGAFIIRDGSGEKAKLQKTIWPEWPQKNVLNRDIPAANVSKIAELAGIDIPADRTFIIVEENGGIGKQYPFTGEKLSVVVTMIRANDFDDALSKMEAILEYQGKGHSCGIHHNGKDDLVNKLALRMKVSRLLVNQPHTLGNSGGWINGMPNTMSLGCSTWGHNSTGSNLTWRDIVNYTVVSRPYDEPVQPKDEDLFSEELRNASL